jgi:hypothetical protein
LEEVMYVEPGIWDALEKDIKQIERSKALSLTLETTTF